MASEAQIRQGIKNLEEHGKETQFKSGRQAAEAGRKGGIKSGIAKRKKFASRKFLKQMLAGTAEKTADMERTLIKLGQDAGLDLTVEDVMVLALIKKAWSGDLRAIDMVHEYLGEDPHAVLEEKKIKVAEQAVSRITNNDGFMEAMGTAVGEVFDDGGDTPDTLEDE